jgi:hypothetical protein
MYIDVQKNLWIIILYDSNYYNEYRNNPEQVVNFYFFKIHIYFNKVNRNLGRSVLNPSSKLLTN